MSVIIAVFAKVSQYSSKNPETLQSALSASSLRVKVVHIFMPFT